MNGRAGWVLELLQQHVACRIRCGNLFRLRDRARHSLCALGKHQRCAVGNDELASLNADGVGHGEGDLVAACCANHRQGDAGVAARWLNDLHAWLQHAALLGVEHHGGAKSALHGVGRVAPLNLGKHRCGGAVGDAVQAHEWRAANGDRVVGEDFWVLNAHVGYLQLHGGWWTTSAAPSAVWSLVAIASARAGRPEGERRASTDARLASGLGNEVGCGHMDIVSPTRGGRYCNVSQPLDAARDPINEAKEAPLAKGGGDPEAPKRGNNLQCEVDRKCPGRSGHDVVHVDPIRRYWAREVVREALADLEAHRHDADDHKRCASGIAIEGEGCQQEC